MVDCYGSLFVPVLLEAAVVELAVEFDSVAFALVELESVELAVVLFDAPVAFDWLAVVFCDVSVKVAFVLEVFVV